MFQSIWLLLTGTKRELDQVNAKLDILKGVLESQLEFLNVLNNDFDRLQQTTDSIYSKQVIFNDATKVRLDFILKTLHQVQAELAPPPAVALVIKLGGVTQGENGMLQVADTGSVTAALEADDALGNAGAALDSPPVWTVSDPALASVSASADGMSASVSLTGKLGKMKLHVEATAGGKALAGDSEEIEILVGAAASLKVSVAVATV